MTSHPSLLLLLAEEVLDGLGAVRGDAHVDLGDVGGDGVAADDPPLPEAPLVGELLVDVLLYTYDIVCIQITKY